MNARVAAVAAKLAALSLRERAMVGAAGIAVIVFLAWGLLIDPDATEVRAARARIADHQADLGRFAQQRTELVAKLAVPPDELQRRELAALDTQVHDLDTRIAALSQGLVPSSRMVETLRGLLARTPGVQVVAIRKLPAAPLVEPAAPEPATPATPAAGTPPDPAARPPVGIWKHGLDIEVEGRYADLVACATRIDAMPVRVLWSDTRIDTVEWPKARMQMRLYTLSLDDAWLTL